MALRKKGIDRHIYERTSLLKKGAGKPKSNLSSSPAFNNIISYYLKFMETGIYRRLNSRYLSMFNEFVELDRKSWKTRLSPEESERAYELYSEIVHLFLENNSLIKKSEMRKSSRKFSLGLAERIKASERKRKINFVRAELSTLNLLYEAASGIKAADLGRLGEELVKIKSGYDFLDFRDSGIEKEIQRMKKLLGIKRFSGNKKSR